MSNVSKINEEKTKELQSLLDMEMINKVIKVMNSKAYRNYSTPCYKEFDTHSEGYWIGDGCYYPSRYTTLEKAARQINGFYLKLIPEVDEYIAEEEAHEQFKGCSWYNTVARYCKTGNLADTYIFVFQKDGKVYKSSFSNYGYHRDRFFVDLKQQKMPLDAELVVVNLRKDGSKNCHNEVEHKYSYYSASSKATKEALRAGYIDFDNPPALEWGIFHGYQPSKGEGDRYTKEGMDTWYYSDTEYFSTF